MDQKLTYQIEDRKFSQRAEVLSNLDDTAEQRREIGICCAALEQATNLQNWPLVERLTQVLLRLRESQQKARERAQELVDLSQFRVNVLTPLLNCITARLQEALPNEYETTIDAIEADLRDIHPRLLEDNR